MAVADLFFLSPSFVNVLTDFNAYGILGSGEVEFEVLILYICFSFLCFKFNIADGFSGFTRKLGSAAEGHKLCELINDLME